MMAQEKNTSKLSEKISEVDEDTVKNIEIMLPNTADISTAESTPISNTMKTVLTIENESLRPDGSVRIETSQHSEIVSQFVNNELALVQNKAKQAQTNAVCQELLQSRAKTVRIGRVRWPPPLNPNETFETELQRYVVLLTHANLPLIESVIFL
jgi:hypothetical protein